MIFWLKHLFEMSTIISRVAAAAKVEKAQAARVLEKLREILKEELRDKKKIHIPGLLCASVRSVPEKPAKTKIVSVRRAIWLANQPGRLCDSSLIRNCASCNETNQQMHMRVLFVFNSAGMV